MKVKVKKRSLSRRSSNAYKPQLASILALLKCVLLGFEAAAVE